MPKSACSCLVQMAWLTSRKAAEHGGRPACLFLACWRLAFSLSPAWTIAVASWCGSLPVGRLTACPPPLFRFDSSCSITSFSSSNTFIGFQIPSSNAPSRPYKGLPTPSGLGGRHPLSHLCTACPLPRLPSLPRITMMCRLDRREVKQPLCQVQVESSLGVTGAWVQTWFCHLAAERLRASSLTVEHLLPGL